MAGVFGTTINMFIILGPVWFDESEKKRFKWEMRTGNVKVQ